MATQRGKRGNQSTASDAAPGAKVSKRQVIRIWEPSEETRIAEYLIEHPYLGKNQCKETLANYLKKMQSQLKIANCSEKQLENKYRAMHTKYEQTFKWINETGQGVRDEDPDPFEEKVMAKCHYYYVVHTVWGSSQAINTSYQRDTGDEITGNAEQSQVASTVDQDDNQDSAGVESDKNTQTDPKSMDSSATAFEKAISGKQKSGTKRGGPVNMTDFLMTPEENKLKIEEEKLSWEKEKWHMEQQAKSIQQEKQMELETRRLELDHELQMRKLDIEREMAIRKLNQSTD